MPPPAFGDMDVESFRQHGHHLVDWIAEYLAGGVERYPALARVAPGDIRKALPAEAPARGEPFDSIIADVQRVLMPGLTHWNHPGFFAYFASSPSGPGILAEFLCAALGQQAMVWQTSPAATELEEVALGWLRNLVGLPNSFEGVIYDTASIGTLHALAAAREAAVPHVRARGLAGRTDLPAPRVYCSEQAHSSVEKAVIVLGLGQTGLVKIPVDREFRMRPAALMEAVATDRAAGRHPIAVVATVGTTSTTSVDPVPAIADICQQEELWLHVDAAYAGAAAIVPSHRSALDGCERADSLVTNPHKWLFTPFDLSAFYCRRMDQIRATFSLVPEYLRAPDADSTLPRARDLMDTGIQLGRRFRALKLWAILRYFGSEGIRTRLAEHIRLAGEFADWIDEHPDFERVAPVPFSVVCFRANPRGSGRTEEELERLNRAVLGAVNATGEVFLSHTKLDGRFVLRLAVGTIRTEERHVRRAWELLQAEHARLR